MNREDPTTTVGRLRHGNPRGNPNDAPRCGAHNRAGLPCRAPAMANGRCRMHGGKSTGPKTREGLERLRAARSVHGFYGAEGRDFRHTIAALFAQGRWLRLLAELRQGQDSRRGTLPDQALEKCTAPSTVTRTCDKCE
jgi:hypothetical protein